MKILFCKSVYHLIDFEVKIKKQERINTEKRIRIITKKSKFILIKSGPSTNKI